jgi:single-stranded-DNA-specific exonuclease
MPRIEVRAFDPGTASTLTGSGIHPVLARIYAARDIASLAQLDTALAGLLPFGELKNSERMAHLLADAIEAGDPLLIVADYDADGATACAVGLLALRAMGAQVDYLVPNRFEYGYGLTPEIVALAAKTGARQVITVDNGIASVEGVAAANALGMKVLVTDHHLPGEQLPDAACIVNPNQAGCPFPSKHLAGVGVMFYVALALRAEFRRRGRFAKQVEPNLASLLDLVALGTVADVVHLDDNNRRLVHQGLQRIRAGKTRPGIAALLEVAGRDGGRTGTYEMGFVVGPRLNAAGRLTDMTTGIECLITQDPLRALELARQLDALNRERRDIEAQMQDSALAMLDTMEVSGAWSLALFEPDWHQGVIGILASRLRERFHRPVIAFARGAAGELKGSGRSIPGLHLRDALDRVTKRCPGLILKFGGHAAAAGLSIAEPSLDAFRDAFEKSVRDMLDAADLDSVIRTDGELQPMELDFALAEAISRQVWGQGFAAPLFAGTFTVAAQRIVGGKHLKLRLQAMDSSTTVDAILFGQEAPLPPVIRAVYRMEINEFRDARTLQLVVQHWEDPLHSP